MNKLTISFAALATLALGACAEQGAHLEASLGMKHDTIIDPALVRQVQADISLSGYGYGATDVGVEVVAAIDSVVKPGSAIAGVTKRDADANHPAFAAGTEHVGAQPPGVAMDVVVKTATEGGVSVHLVAYDDKGLWKSQPGTYKVEVLPPPTKTAPTADKPTTKKGKAKPVAQN